MHKYKKITLKLYSVQPEKSSIYAALSRFFQLDKRINFRGIYDAQV